MHPDFKPMLDHAPGQADQAHHHLERPLDRGDRRRGRARLRGRRVLDRLPDDEEQDAQRGPGNWDLVMEQAARCRRLGVGVTFIAVMMRTNYDRLAEIARIAKAFDAPLRINVYQAVRSDAFALTYDEYWTGFEALFAQTDVIAIGEPLVRAMAGLPARRGGCGVATVRVTPRATRAALRLLAGLRPGARSPAAMRARPSSTRGRSRRPAGLPDPVPGLRLRGAMPRRLRGPPAPPASAGPARPVLPRGARRHAPARHPHGGRPRLAEAGKRLHDDRDRP